MLLARDGVLLSDGVTDAVLATDGTMLGSVLLSSDSIESADLTTSSLLSVAIITATTTAEATFPSPPASNIVIDNFVDKERIISRLRSRPVRLCPSWRTMFDALC